MAVRPLAWDGTPVDHDETDQAETGGTVSAAGLTTGRDGRAVGRIDRAVGLSAQEVVESEEDAERFGPIPPEADGSVDRLGDESEAYSEAQVAEKPREGAS